MGYNFDLSRQGLSCEKILQMKCIRSILTASMLLTSASIMAQQFIYPAEGQSPELQQKDEGECYVWAKGQTGFDPAAPPPASQASTSAPAKRKRGGILRGAVVGAAVGEIVDDDAGEGAAAGAIIAGSRQAKRNAAAQQKQQAKAANSQAKVDDQRATYSRAFSACLEGRGYTVK